MRIALERPVDRLVALAQHRGAVDVDGRACGSRDVGERHAVADERVAVSVGVPVEAGRAGRLSQRDRVFYSTHMIPEAGDAVEALIQRCLQGDQLAWEQIVRQYWRKVFNVAYKFVGKHDEAEDLTQDIFLKIFKSLNTFDRRANFQTWLISISRNLCIDHYRSVRKERETIDRDVDANELSPLSHDPGPVAALEQQDRVQLLREAMASLPDTLRTAVLMRDIQELSYQEIADKLRLPEGTVKSRINRGRTELARRIRQLRGDDFGHKGTMLKRTGANR
jgi:RNA polymerase sigma-70 factor (ECF subfamily)